MSVSQASACNFVPLLARLVLGGAFITAGYAKVFTYQDFPTHRIEALEDGAQIDINLRPNQNENGESAGDEEAGRRSSDSNIAWSRETGDEGPSIHLVSYSPQEPGRLRPRRSAEREKTQESQTTGEQEETGGEEAEGTQESAKQEAGQADPESGQQTEETGAPPQQEEKQQEEPAVEEEQAPPSEETVRERSLYQVALMLHDAGWDQYNVLLAWLTALTELIGGSLILIGLFSRIWGLGLAIVMGVAFYVTSLTGAAMPGSGGLLGEGLDYLMNDPGGQKYNAMFAQLGLFVLAFGILLTGPGAVSVDRLLFKGGRQDTPVDVELS